MDGLGSAPGERNPTDFELGRRACNGLVAQGHGTNRTGQPTLDAPALRSSPPSAGATLARSTHESTDLRVCLSSVGSRNLAMLDEKPDLVIAFQINGSAGTQHTIDQARKRGIPVEVHRG